MMITELPRDILGIILDSVPAETVLILGQVNRYFYGLSNDEYIWRKRCFDHFNINHDISFRQTGWKRLFFAFRNPSVYVWGENSDGRLGLYPPISEDGFSLARRRRHITSRVTKPKELVALKGKGIVDIVSGGWSFHALDKEGHIWFWGRMTNEQHFSSLGYEMVISPVQIASSAKFKSIATGRSHGIGLAHDGSVWHWSSHRILQEISTEDRIIQVTANWDYSSLLTDTGSILLVPAPDQIENALGPDLQLNPTEVAVHFSSREILGDEEDTLVQLAGLEHYTLALSQFGQVYLLTTQLQGFVFNPPPVFSQRLTHFCAAQNEMNDRKGKMKRFITGGFRNFAVYTENDTVLVGHTHSGSEQTPHTISGMNLCKVSFGDYHQGAVTSKGQVMTWGQFSSGALGQGEEADRVESPQLVDTLKDKYTVSIGFGGWQSSALVVDI
ncbi:regulator of chromosome condensation 1/beta-lactamase-inhibitor protein II [Sporodiniella umbellata]|nr:regulator of chromosome condensation 1/beta-lactamase-inhibitor protein II [Sporodiniella umbellata]